MGAGWVERVLGGDLRAEGGDVVAGVAFAGYVEGRVQEGGEDGADEELQEVVHVFGRCETGSWDGGSFVEVGEAYTRGLVDEDDVCVFAPSVFVVYGAVAMFVDQAGS